MNYKLFLTVPLIATVAACGGGGGTPPVDETNTLNLAGEEKMPTIVEFLNSADNEEFFVPVYTVKRDGITTEFNNYRRDDDVEIFVEKDQDGDPRLIVQAFGDEIILDKDAVLKDYPNTFIIAKGDTNYYIEFADTPAIADFVNGTADAKYHIPFSIHKFPSTATAESQLDGYRGAYGAAGFVTPTARLPQTTANYSGIWRGIAIETADYSNTAFESDAALSLNFANDVFLGSFTNMEKWDSETKKWIAWSEIDDLNLTNIQNLGDGYLFGEVTSTCESCAAYGDFSLNVFGPNGQEVAGGAHVTINRGHEDDVFLTGVVTTIKDN